MSYSFIRTITIDHTKCGSVDSINFPVLFAPGAVGSLATVANGGHVQNSSGFDIIFTSDSAGTVLLKWEVESYDPTTGTIIAWVQVPTVSHSANTVIYCVYGNASISSFQGGAAGAAWNSDFAAVYHFTNDGSGNLLANDSTANGNNGTLTNTPTLASPVSVGEAADFVGSSSQSINFGSNSSLELTGDLTLECWIDPGTQPDSFSGILSNIDYGGAESGYTLAFNNSVPQLFAQVGNAGTFGSNAFTSRPGAGWSYIVFTISTVSAAAVYTLYVNASNVYSGPGGQFPASGAALVAAASAVSLANRYTGLLDEVRLSSIARGADWFITVNNNFSSPTTFSSLGSEMTFLQTVGPSAATSRRNVGTPFIQVPGIGPAAAVSRRNVGTPIVNPGSVHPSFAPTRRAVGLPNIAGPIGPFAAVSRRNVGTPTLNAIQTVNPGAAPSRRNVGTPTVDIVQSIAPAAAVSRRNVGTPTLTGGPNFVFPRAAVSRRACGIPAITGGDGQLTVYVGGSVYQGNVLSKGGSDTGSPVTYESANPPTITSQTLGRWTLEVDLIDTTGQYAPARGQTILLVEGGLNLFAGCIQEVAYQRLLGTKQTIIYHVTATDKSGICDRRVVLPTTYPAGSDVAQTILSILANNLNGEGIIATPQSVPTDGSLGTLAADLVCNYETVTTDFNQLATYSGTLWYVDQLGVLWFNSFDNLPVAPFGLSENADGSGSSENYRALLVSQTNVGYANQIFAVSNLTTVPGSSGGGGAPSDGTGSTTETYTLEVGAIGTITDGAGNILGVNVTMPIGTLYSLTVNGTVQDKLYNLAALPVPPTPTPETPPQYGPWYFLNAQAEGGGAATTIGASVYVPAGAVVVVNYTPATPNAQTSTGEALQPVDPATGGTLGTCGSGTYQLAIQVQNVSSNTSLNAIAAAELAKRGVLNTFITFQTDKPGLMPGMRLPVDIPLLYLNDLTFVITAMQGIAAEWPLEFGSRFQWQVTAQTNTDLGNWFQWYATLLQNAANPLPVPQYEDASFVLGAGSNIAGGLQSTNPYQVKNTGQLLVEFAAAGIPPQDQDLVITFNLNGALIEGCKVTIPAGSTPNTSFASQFSTTDPIYVFNTANEQDVITINAAYNITGPNPIPASNVSATLRWSF